MIGLAPCRAAIDLAVINGMKRTARYLIVAWHKHCGVERRAARAEIALFRV